MGDVRRRKSKLRPFAAAAYAAIGLGLTIPVLLLGSRLVSPVGVVIVSGTITVAVLLSMLLHVRSRMAATDVRLSRLGAQLNRLKRRKESGEGAGANEQPVEWLDLAAIGAGSPDDLVAATLDRSTFPRLLATMEEKAPPQAGPDTSARACESHDDLDSPSYSSQEAPDPAHHRTDGVTMLNQLRRWKLGLRTGDLASCRAVFSALVDTADPSTVASLEEQLEALADRAERSLREAFSRHVQQKDFAGMLAVGDEICRLLPDRPVAEDFLRIRPHLIRKQTQRRSDTNSSLRIVN